MSYAPIWKANYLLLLEPCIRRGDVVLRAQIGSTSPPLSVSAASLEANLSCLRRRGFAGEEFASSNFTEVISRYSEILTRTRDTRGFRFEVRAACSHAPSIGDSPIHSAVRSPRRRDAGRIPMQPHTRVQKGSRGPEARSVAQKSPAEDHQHPRHRPEPAASHSR